MTENIWTNPFQNFLSGLPVVVLELFYWLI